MVIDNKKEREMMIIVKQSIICLYAFKVVYRDVVFDMYLILNFNYKMGL